ncbi:hypothetical protein EDC27_0836 [Desulfosoma caldarium]|uniref:Uncharacterized protein n=1 Tax=Desulfosoma caldarium TaxID=610254 RepID=A0A3N1VP18_9BACT|nr:hypothetical protein EDC27_0836 [Desulfosoma caldarium]
MIKEPQPFYPEPSILPHLHDMGRVARRATLIGWSFVQESIGHQEAPIKPTPDQAPHAVFNAPRPV